MKYKQETEIKTYRLKKTNINKLEELKVKLGLNYDELFEYLINKK